jgi:hypothetical protein
MRSGGDVVRVRMHGVNTVRKRLADGTVAIYYYHRATGTRLQGRPNETIRNFVCRRA